MAKKRLHGGKREGAGRKPKYGEARTAQFSISCPPELLERLDTVRGDASRSEFVVALLLRHLEHKRRIG